MDYEPLHGIRMHIKQSVKFSMEDHRIYPLLLRLIETVRYCLLINSAFLISQIICVFQRPSKAKLFLKGIKMIQAVGSVCLNGQCQFVLYEDLPVYTPEGDPPISTQRH